MSIYTRHIPHLVSRMAVTMSQGGTLSALFRKEQEVTGIVLSPSSAYLQLPNASKEEVDRGVVGMRMTIATFVQLYPSEWSHEVIGKCYDLLDIYITKTDHPLLDVRRPELPLAVFQIVFKLYNTNFPTLWDLQTLARQHPTRFAYPELVQYVTAFTITEWERKVLTVLEYNVLTVCAWDFMQVLKANFPFAWQTTPRVNCLENCLSTASAVFFRHEVPPSVICAFAVHAVASRLMHPPRTLWDLPFVPQEFKDRMLPFREHIEGMYAEIPPYAHLDDLFTQALQMIHVSHQG